jgi:hypothetical protein
MCQTAPTTHLATRTGRTVRRYDVEAPEYKVTKIAPLKGYDDVVELSDGTHAYLLDFGGYWALYRRREAYVYGSAGEAVNSRTAPESGLGLIGEANVAPCDRDSVRACGADLVGFAELTDDDVPAGAQRLIEQLAAIGLELRPLCAPTEQLTNVQLHQAVKLLLGYEVAS